MNLAVFLSSRRRAIRGLGLVALAGALAAAPALAADVNVSVRIGDPMYYGRIDFGSTPPPPVIYTRPVVIAPIAQPAPPVYLRVPPGHAQNWAKHCSRYDACGHRVYFVQDSWYRNVYVPQHRHGHGEGHGHDNGKGKGHDKGKHGD